MKPIKLSNSTRCILLLAILSSLSIHVVDAQPQTGFRVDGMAKGMRASTRLYLEFRRDGALVKDSTLVVGEKFRFAGMAQSPAEYALVRTKDLSDYTFFWIENRDMTFTAEKGHFKAAFITGSKTEDESIELEQMLAKAKGDRQPEHDTFIASHPNSLVSAQVLSVYASTWGKQKVAALYEK